MADRHPLRNRCWALVVGAAGRVQGRSFWMSQPTYAALLNERSFSRVQQAYGVAIQIDNTMSYGHITLERRKTP